MEQITIKNLLDVDSSITFGLAPYSKSIVIKGTQKMQWMGMDEIELTVHSNITLPLKVNAKTVLFGRPYFMNFPPTIEKLGKHDFVYTITMQGMYSVLSRTLFFNSFPDELEFSIIGSPDIFFDLILQNLGRSTDERAAFFYTMLNPINDVMMITFSNDNCQTALQKILDTFHLMYYTSYSEVFGISYVSYQFIRKTSFRTYNETPIWGNGLTKLKVSAEQDHKFATKVYPIGSDRNIPTDYRNYSKRLKPSGVIPYVELNDMVQNYGSIESVEIVDSIYPRLNASITSIPTGFDVTHVSVTTAPGDFIVYFVNPNDSKYYKINAVITGNPNIVSGSKIVEVFSNRFRMDIAALSEAYVVDTILTTPTVENASFIDINMEFDLNSKDENGSIYLADGVTPKIVMMSGNLSGYSFIIKSYNHITKRFEVIPITDERGLTIPDSNIFNFQIGDKYILADIKLPQSYIDDAEEELRTYVETLIYPEVSKFNNTADVEFNEFWIRDKFNSAEGFKYYVSHDPSLSTPRAFNNLFECGYLIYIPDPDLNVGMLVITGVERDIARDFSYSKITLGVNKFTSLALTILKRSDVFYGKYSLNVINAREQQTTLNYLPK